MERHGVQQSAGCMSKETGQKQDTTFTVLMHPEMYLVAVHLID